MDRCPECGEIFDGRDPRPLCKECDEWQREDPETFDLPESRQERFDFIAMLRVGGRLP